MSETQIETRTVLSGDGMYWWNGERWLPALTEDGLWQWKGTAWAPTMELAGRKPHDLAEIFAKLADERYAEAGAILVERGPSWRAEGEARELLTQLQISERRGRGVKRLQKAQRWLEPLGRTSEGAQTEETPDDGGEVWTRETHVALGRKAPRPSVREADDILVVARSLDERAISLREAAGELDAAERRRAEAIAGAEEAVAEAEVPRREAIAAARKDVEAAEADHARARAEARAELRRLHKPGRGELRAEAKGLRLYTHMLQTPAGSLPAAGVRAYLDTAPALWSAQHEVLSSLILLQVPGVEPLLDELVDRGSALFLLIVARTGAHLQPCPPVDEEVIRGFVEHVTANSSEAVRAQEARDGSARRAEDNLERVASDRSAVHEAEARLARTETDSDLLSPIDAARARLAEAREDTPELIRARKWVEEFFQRCIEAPAPLRSVTDL
jgi:hypothetical protein